MNFLLLNLAAAAGQCLPVEKVPQPPVAVVAPNSTYYSNGSPPERFRTGVKFVVVFGTADEVHATCAAAALPVPCGSRYGGCVIGSTVHVPNPCERTGDYADLLCHELAHVNGWPASHGN